MKATFLLAVIFIGTSWALQAQTPTPPTNISTIEGLYAVRDVLGGSYVLTRDLDFADAGSYAGDEVNGDYRPDNAEASLATNAGFPPIGSAAFPFTGVFDGGGYVIRNLYSRSSVDGGLFGAIAAATITDLGLEVHITASGGSTGGGITGLVASGATTLTNCYVTGVVNGDDTGGLIGRNEGTVTVTGSYVTGEIYGDADSGGSGGLVGRNLGGGLTLTDCYATGDISDGRYTGGLVGRSAGGLTLTNSYAIGDTYGGREHKGGLVGLLESEASLENGADHTALISHCYAIGLTLVSRRRTGAGGLVGKIGDVASVTIANSYATGSAGGKLGIAGGIVGIVEGTAKLALTNCYATGEIRVLVGQNGALVGQGEATIVASYWNRQTTGQAISVVGGTAQTTQQLQRLTANLSGWSEDDWDFGTNEQYPALRRSTGVAGTQGALICYQPAERVQCAPREIQTVEDLINIYDDMSGHYVLLNNIDFAEAGSYAGDEVNEDYRPNHATPSLATNAGFPPIERKNRAFTGTLDGGGYVIRNLYIRGQDEAALFVETAGATITDLGLENVYISGSAFGSLGGIVANYGGGLLRDCYVTGEIRGVKATRMGGLIGASRNGATITNCYVTATLSVEGLDSSIGGLVGDSYDVLTIENSYVTATLSAEGTDSDIGGLVGGSYNVLTIEDSYTTGDMSLLNSVGNTGGLVGLSDISLTITNSYTTGTIQGSYHTGGFVGSTTGGSTTTIGNCYTTGAVSTAGTLTNLANETRAAGGIVGLNRDVLVITNTYATGAVTATGGTAGGLIGFSKDSPTVNKSYWNSQTTGQTTSTGGGTAQTTEQLQGLTATTTGWSADDWDFGSDSQYPALRRTTGELFCDQPTPRVQCTLPPTPPAPPTPLGVLGAESNGVTLSPNPTADVLFVRGEASSITLLDVSGRVVLSQLLTSNRLNLSDLPAGLYVARITTPSGIITRRVARQ